MAPKIASVVGWTGSRSSPSTSGFSPVRRRRPCDQPPVRLLDRVAAELVAQRGEHAVRRSRRCRASRSARTATAVITGVGTSMSIAVARSSSGPRRSRRRSRARPLEVVALLLERARGELAQPGAHDRAVVPELGDLLEVELELATCAGGRSPRRRPASSRTRRRCGPSSRSGRRRRRRSGASRPAARARRGSARAARPTRRGRRPSCSSRPRGPRRRRTCRRRRSGCPSARAARGAALVVGPVRVAAVDDRVARRRAASASCVDGLLGRIARRAP